MLSLCLKHTLRQITSSLVIKRPPSSWKCRESAPCHARYAPAFAIRGSAGPVAACNTWITCSLISLQTEFLDYQQCSQVIPNLLVKVAPSKAFGFLESINWQVTHSIRRPSFYSPFFSTHHTSHRLLLLANRHQHQHPGATY